MGWERALEPHLPGPILPDPIPSGAPGPLLGVNNLVEIVLVVPLLVLRDEFRTLLGELSSCA